MKALIRWLTRLGVWCPTHGLLRLSELADCTRCRLDEITAWSHRVRDTPTLRERALRGEPVPFTLTDQPSDYLADEVPYVFVPYA